MSEIHVQFDALQAGASGIHNSYVALSATLEQLAGDLQPMVASWSGEAQQAYLHNKRQWDAAAQALAQVLETIGSAVGQAHENYVNAESSALSNWA